MLPGEGIAHDATGRIQAGGKWVVQLILRSERQQLREIAVAHPFRRHAGRAVVARARLGNRFVAVGEERPVLDDRAVRSAGPAGVPEVGQRNVVRVREEVVGHHRPRRLHVVGLAVEHVGAGLQHQIRDAPFGVPQGCVERCRFDLEFLDETLGRYERRGDLAGIGRGAARDPVDRHVAAIRARAIHREADDVRRFERPIEARRTLERRSWRQADERERVAVRNRQLGDTPCVDDLSERSTARLEERCRRVDRHFFRGSANLQRQLELQPVADTNLDTATDERPEARELDADPIVTGNQIRRLKEALIVRDDGDVGAHRHVGDGDLCAGQHAFAGVEDRARNRAASLLRVRGAVQPRQQGGDQNGRTQKSNPDQSHADPPSRGT